MPGELREGEIKHTYGDLNSRKQYWPVFEEPTFTENMYADFLVVITCTFKFKCEYLCSSLMGYSLILD